MIDFSFILNVLSSAGHFVFNLPISAVAAVFGVYFAWRRLGHHISVESSFLAEGMGAGRVGKVILINNKDRPEVVKGVDLIVPGKCVLPVVKLDRPVVLKAMETLALDVPEVSYFLLGGARVDAFDLVMDEKSWFRIATNRRYIRARRAGKPLKPGTLPVVTTFTKTHNGFVVDESFIFAIPHSVNGQKRTAFIHESGLIEGEWDFSKFNGFQAADLGSVAAVGAVLAREGFGLYAQHFRVVDLRKS